MKILNSSSGCYLTEVQETFSDAETLNSIFRDYVIPKTLRGCLDMCSVSATTLNDSRAVISPHPRIDAGVFFLCNSSHEKVGAITFTFSNNGSTTTTYLTKVTAVIKSSERGKGYFTQMFMLISWFANQFLQCDYAQVGVTDTAPQVAGKLDARAVTNYETTDTSLSNVPYNSVVQKQLNLTDYANSFSEEEWSGISFIVGDTTVPVPTKGVPSF